MKTFSKLKVKTLTLKAFLSLLLAAILLMGSMKLSSAYALAAPLAQDEQEQSSKKQESKWETINGIKVRQYKPGEKLPAFVTDLADNLNKYDKVYKKAVPLLDNWMPGDNRRAKGLAMLRKAALDGHARSMARYSTEINNFNHLYSDKVQKEAAELHEKALALGDPFAHATMAAILYRSNHKEKAKEYFEKAIILGPRDGETLYLYGAWLFNGSFGKELKQQGVKYIQKAAKYGDLDAQYLVATLTYEGGGGYKKDISKALEIVKKLTTEIFPRAAYSLAIHTSRDSSSVNDKIEMLKSLEKSFGVRDASNITIYAIGIHGEEVFGCKVDPGLAMAWLQYAWDYTEKTKARNFLLKRNYQTLPKSLTPEEKKRFEELSKLPRPPFVDKNPDNFRCGK